MSTPLQKLKRLQAMKQGDEINPMQGGFASHMPSDKVVIIMNKWNIFFILLFQIILGFLFFGLGFLFCLKTSESLAQRKEEVRKPAYGKLYIPTSTADAQDRSIVQSMDEYDKR